MNLEILLPFKMKPIFAIQLSLRNDRFLFPVLVAAPRFGDWCVKSTMCAVHVNSFLRLSAADILDQQTFCGLSGTPCGIDNTFFP